MISRKDLHVMILMALGFGSTVYAQRSEENVRVNVQRSQEGEAIEFEEIVPASDAQDLEGLMKKYGMDQELGELKPGEEVEIIVRRKQTADPAKQMTMEADKPPVAPAKPVAPVSKQAFLGVHYEMIYGSMRGSHVTRVEPGTPASRAGMQPGDVITAADGEELFSIDDLARIIATKKAGEKVKLSYIRNGKPSSVMVTLAERDENFFRNAPAQPQFRPQSGPSSGIWIEDKPGSDAALINDGYLGVLVLHSERYTSINGKEVVEESKGGIVNEVVPNSPAESMGIKKGDVIRSINGKPIALPGDVADIVGGMRSGDKVKVEVLRDGKVTTVNGALKSRKEFNLGEPRMTEREISYEMDGGDAEMLDRVRRMMEEAKARANGNTIREFRLIITMDELSPSEAQSLSLKSGRNIQADSDLDLRGLRLSPNPSSGKFNVAFDLPQRGDTRIEVLDMNGNLIYNEMLNNYIGHYAKDFDISEESKGVYVLRILQNGKSFTRKILTQ